MQAKRKLTALLLSLCMLLGMLPMTAFAAGVPAAPTNLKLERTETGLKASWDKPETTGGLDIFEYEVTLYGHFDGTAGEKTKVETKTVQRETTCLRHRRPGQSIGLLCDGVDWLEQFELSIV